MCAFNFFYMLTGKLCLIRWRIKYWCGGGSIKIPIFDGTSPYHGQRLKFSSIQLLDRNQGRDYIGIGVAVTCGRKVADSIKSRTPLKLDEIVRAIEMRHGGAHLYPLQRVMLRNRGQNTNETLQHLFGDIDRLVSEIVGDSELLELKELVQNVRSVNQD